MVSATPFNLDSGVRLTGPAPTQPPSDDVQLREALKYCAPSIYEAALQFRKTAQPEYAAVVLEGILAHYVEPDRRPLLRRPREELRLNEDLDLDSLTLMEIVIRLEDALQISVRDDELRQFRTLGEVRGLIDRTLASTAPRPFPSGSAHP